MAARSSSAGRAVLDTAAAPRVLAGRRPSPARSLCNLKERLVLFSSLNRRQLQVRFTCAKQPKTQLSQSTAQASAGPGSRRTCIRALRQPPPPAVQPAPHPTPTPQPARLDYLHLLAGGKAAAAGAGGLPAGGESAGAEALVLPQLEVTRQPLLLLLLCRHSVGVLRQRRRHGGWLRRWCPPPLHMAAAH